MTAEATGAKQRIRSFRKPALRLTLFLALVLFLLTTETCHNHLFLFPSSKIEKTPADFHVPYEEVVFRNAGGKQLAGWYCPAENPIGALVLNHGNTGNIGTCVEYVNHLPKAGVSVLLYDYQGFGNSEGRASISSLVGDGLAAFDYLASRVNGDDKVAVMGLSLGTPISCAVAQQRPKAAALILEGSFLPETELYWRMGTLGAPVAFVISKSLPPIRPQRAVQALNGRPLLMIHGDKDRVTPLYGAAELFEKALPPKWLWVMEDAGHFPGPMLYKHGSYPKVLAAFLRHAFRDEPFDQPQVKNWSCTKAGRGRWQVAARVYAPRGPAAVVVCAEGNVTVRKESLPAGLYETRIESLRRPITVSAFVEPQAAEPQSDAP